MAEVKLRKRVVTDTSSGKTSVLFMYDNAEAWFVAYQAARELVQGAEKSHWRLSHDGWLLPETETIGDRQEFELVEIGGAV